MGKSSRRAFGQVAVGFAFFLSLANGAAAQSSTAQAVDPHSFDIAGVKLGMTVDQTVAALESANSKYTIIKNYWGNAVTEYAQTGTPLNTISTWANSEQGGSFEPLTENFAFLNDLVAELGPPSCVNGTGDPCTQYGTPRNDVIQVWFSPVPGQEHVIAVARTDQYDASNLDDQTNIPSFSATEAALLAKYSIAPSVRLVTGTTDMDWLFDGRGRYISADRLKELGKYVVPLGGGLPNSVSPGDGITLSVSLNPTDSSDKTVDIITESLFDGNALYNSIAQGEATYKAQKAKMDSEAPKNSSTPSL